MEEPLIVNLATDKEPLRLQLSAAGTLLARIENIQGVHAPDHFGAESPVLDPLQIWLADFGRRYPVIHAEDNTWRSKGLRPGRYTLHLQRGRERHQETVVIERNVMHELTVQF